MEQSTTFQLFSQYTQRQSYVESSYICINNQLHYDCNIVISKVSVKNMIFHQVHLNAEFLVSCWTEVVMATFDFDCNRLPCT